MARPKANLEMVTMRLTKGAKERLGAFYKDIGYNMAIRLMVDKHLEFLEQQIKPTELALNQELQAAAAKLLQET